MYIDIGNDRKTPEDDGKYQRHRSVFETRNAAFNRVGGGFQHYLQYKQ
jgi:hypothetical protein